PLSSTCATSLPSSLQTGLLLTPSYRKSPAQESIFCWSARPATIVDRTTRTPWETLHRRAISLLDHSFHCSSRSIKETALRLSAEVRRNPCAALAPSANNCASRLVPLRTSQRRCVTLPPVRMAAARR